MIFPPSQIWNTNSQHAKTNFKRSHLPTTKTISVSALLFFFPPWLENTKFLVFCFRIFPSSTVRQPWLLSFPIICLRTFPKRKLLFPVRKKTALLRVHLANPGACNAQLKVISTIFFFVRRCLWHCNGARCVWVWDCTCVCVWCVWCLFYVWVVIEFCFY